MRKGTNKEEIFKYLKQQCELQLKDSEETKGCDTIKIAEALNIKRTNVSKALNELYSEGLVIKIKGKPVLYAVNFNKNTSKLSLNFERLIGSEKSINKAIQQAKAAMLYPPRGLYTLILGETGVGKTMFAELMHRFAIENGVLPPSAPFITFNCADYANNSQLLLAHLFGAKKGAYTGLDRDSKGLVEKADNGILFLDEVHRLPPEGQETLFYLMDKGEFSALGDASNVKKSDVLIICATTENIDTSLLTTFTRRIPITITIPPLRERTFEERYELVCEFLKAESARIGRDIIVTPNSLRGLLLYNCTGNVGQLKSDIQIGCANAFLKWISKREKQIKLHSEDFADYVKEGLNHYEINKEVINSIIEENKMLSFSPTGIEEIADSTSITNKSHLNNNCEIVVVVAMHGRNTASSMVEVAQRLVGYSNIYAYDMSLDKSSVEAYNELKDLIVNKNREAGVLLLVDMGSLKMYGELIERETNIKVRVIEMSSTITVIECAIKAQIEKNIDDIWYSVNDNNIKFYNTAVQPMLDVYRKR